MKPHIILSWIFVGSFMSSCTVYNNTTYTDAIYSSHPDVVRQNPVRPNANNNQQSTAPSYQGDDFVPYSEQYIDEGGNQITNNYYGETYVGTYASRINRFQRPVVGLSYYSPVYNPGWSVGFGYNSFWGSSFSIGWNSGWYDPFCDPFWDPWCYRGWGWNRGFYSPWAWNSWAWNRPWYGPNYYYAPVYNDGFYGRANARNSISRYGTNPSRSSGYNRSYSRGSVGNSGQQPEQNYRQPAKNDQGTRPVARPGSGNTNPTARPTREPYARPDQPTRNPQPRPNNNSYGTPRQGLDNGGSKSYDNRSPQRDVRQRPQSRSNNRSFQRSAPTRSYSPSRSSGGSRSYGRSSGGSSSRRPR
ncbi:MAG: hypothetical protein ACPF8V_07910 [Luteibaculum sp.]